MIDNLNKDGSPASLDKINYYSVSSIHSDRTYYNFNLYVANDQSFGFYKVSFLPLNGEYYNSHDELFANIVEHPERLKIKTIGVSPLISLEDYQWPQNAAAVKNTAAKNLPNAYNHYFKKTTVGTVPLKSNVLPHLAKTNKTAVSCRTF